MIQNLIVVTSAQAKTLVGHDGTPLERAMSVEQQNKIKSAFKFGRVDEAMLKRLETNIVLAAQHWFVTLPACGIRTPHEEISGMYPYAGDVNLCKYYPEQTKRYPKATAFLSFAL